MANRDLERRNLQRELENIPITDRDEINAAIQLLQDSPAVSALRTTYRTRERFVRVLPREGQAQEGVPQFMKDVPREIVQIFIANQESTIRQQRASLENDMILQGFSGRAIEGILGIIHRTAQTEMTMPEPVEVLPQPVRVGRRMPRLPGR